MFWLLGSPAGTGGSPQHRPGRPRACESPARENGKPTQVGAFALLLWGCRAPGARFGGAVFRRGIHRIATYQRYSNVWRSDLTQIRRWAQTQAPSAPRAAIRYFLAPLGKCFPAMPLSTKEMASMQRLPLRCQSRSRNELSEFAWYTAPSGALFCI
jgi:hypothetical protein